jgi:hypothetical protein
MTTWLVARNIIDITVLIMKQRSELWNNDSELWHNDINIDISTIIINPIPSP